MLENIENLHKQIASFIVLSAALAVPSQAETLSANGELVADAAVNMNLNNIQHQEVMLFYGSPQLPPAQVIPPGTIEVPGNVALYAAPQIPIQHIETPVFPIVEPVPALPSPTPALNESSLNINNNINNGNIGGNVNVGAQEALNKLNKVDANIINVKTNINSSTNGFVNTEFGNVRVIEPFAHFVFK